MINKAYFYNNKESLIPYTTLALEEAMLYGLQKSEIILYLYTHRSAVIIGKNQNAWKECRFEPLERDGGQLARRISGGGAVYHDINNLNFSFIVNREDYSVERQLKVIADAVSEFGIKAEVSGRNDILTDGKKFSGNAFCFKEDKAFHHGTILIDVDSEKMSEYLNVSKDKIESKGIKSVKSRVCNLKDLNPEITNDKMAAALRRAFDREYGASEDYLISPVMRENTEIIAKRNQTWEWKFGYQGNFDITTRKRFGWGDAEICLNLHDAVIREARIFSDAMDADFIGIVASALVGCRLEAGELKKAMQNIAVTDEQKLIRDDIYTFLITRED